VCLRKESDVNVTKNRLAGDLAASTRCDLAMPARPRMSLAWLGVAFLALLDPAYSFAESNTGAASAGASVNFRINIPAIMRVTPVTQPARLTIEQKHIAQGYIDFEASVKLTNNTRSVYSVSASYDVQLLSKVEVRVSGQQLSVSSGAGNIHIASGLAFDKLVPISYRLHLAPGTGQGEYRWPVALAFSLSAV
jgi:hypothetical protein